MSPSGSSALLLGPITGTCILTMSACAVNRIPGQAVYNCYRFFHRRQDSESFLRASSIASKQSASVSDVV